MKCRVRYLCYFIKFYFCSVGKKDLNLLTFSSLEHILIEETFSNLINVIKRVIDKVNKK